MNDGELLRQSVIANPADNTVRLAYADWCDENNNPLLAAFIRREIARKQEDPEYPDYPSVTPWRRSNSDVMYWGADGNARLWKKGEIRKACEWLPVPGGEDYMNFTFARGFASRWNCVTSVFLSHAAQVFHGNPIERVWIDKEPMWIAANASRPDTWDFWEDRDTNGGLERDIPPAIFRIMWDAANAEWRQQTWQRWLEFPSKNGARESLSRACVAYGRQQAELLK